MKENILVEKSFAFAVRVINAYKYLEEQKEYAVSKAFLQGGTDIGAHVEEALGGASRSDFLFELTNATKKRGKPNIGLDSCRKQNFLKKFNLKACSKMPKKYFG